MTRILLLMALIVPCHAFAQMSRADHEHAHGRMATESRDAGVPTSPGQGAFAAIQEIVSLLEADPSTDWSRVDIEALRHHLIDMDNVTLRAEVNARDVAGGERFEITGSGPVKGSIQRMVTAHAATMNGAGEWRMAAESTDDGAILTVLVPERDLAKLRALGFMGVLTRGMHHQAHHLMIARGGHPHH
jgi:hypothetical protein